MKNRCYVKTISFLLVGILTLLLFGCGRGSVVVVPTLKDCPVIKEEEFGGVYIQTSADELTELGFEFGDSVDVYFSNGYEMEDIPYYNGYYTQAGEALLLAYPSYEYIDCCINYGGSLWSIAELEEGMTATITVNKKAKYLDVQEVMNISYQDDPEQFPSEAVFANFRSFSPGRIKEGLLYRSASPCNNVHGRAPYVDQLQKKLEG